MADSLWSGFMDSISGEEKLLPPAIYEVEVTSARAFVKDGEVRRGMFWDLMVTKGPQKSESISVYVSIPEPGDRKAGYWYGKKMAGFGDLTTVYESMPEDLQGGIDVLCASITGRRILANISPGVGDYSNRNSLGDTKPTDVAAVPPTTVEAPVDSAGGEESAESTPGAADTSSPPSDEPGF